MRRSHYRIFFDVVHYETLDEPRLVEHIDRVGIVIFRRFAEPSVRGALVLEEAGEPSKTLDL